MQSMSKMEYKFKKQDPELCYKPEKIEFSFYQICSFKNNNTKKYSVRKIVFDENNEIIKMYENEYSEKLLNKFIKKSPKHKYKIYATSDLNMIDLPTNDQILNSNSEILNNKYDYTGFKQF